MTEHTNKVSVLSAAELLQKKLVIPEYQRPYTWTEKHLNKMLEDFKEFDDSKYKNAGYYLGTILLHKDKDVDTYNIVDGQQRVTSLLLLLNIAKVIANQVDIIYSNPISQQHIKENYKHLKKNLNDDCYNLIKHVFENTNFTVIETDHVDDAFTFFDTQNNRGIRPSVLVLLKAFNLRSISNKVSQKKCAEKWEQHEKDQKEAVAYTIEESDKLEWIIQIFFYRVRNWRGSNSKSFGGYEAIRDGFTKELRQGSESLYKQYPSFLNQVVLTNSSQTIFSSKNMDWFKFAVRQPVYQGEGFFEFVDYYGNLVDELMELEVFQGKPFRYLIRVHKTGSRFIASFLTMVVATYYDRFGESNIIKFVKLLDILLANIRLTQSRILKQTMNKQFIRCENTHIKQNILDFISAAFDSDEVIDWMNHKQSVSNVEESLSGVKEQFHIKYKDFWSETK